VTDHLAANARVQFRRVESLHEKRRLSAILAVASRKRRRVAAFRNLECADLAALCGWQTLTRNFWLW